MKIKKFLRWFFTGLFVLVLVIILWSVDGSEFPREPTIGDWIAHYLFIGILSLIGLFCFWEAVYYLKKRAR